MAELAHLNDHLPAELSLVSYRVKDGIVIQVSGEIDLATAGSLEQELIGAENSYTLVVLDLRETSFMDSTGIHLIVSTNRRLREHGGRLVVVHGPPPVQRLLKLTGVADHVELVYDAAELGLAAPPAPAPRPTEPCMVA